MWWVGAVALVAVLFVVVLLVRVFKKRKLGDTVLLLGICNAGKTALFMQLREGKISDTHTSMKENEDSVALRLKNAKTLPVRVVDFPGSPRLRAQLERFLPRARLIVFLIDAVEIRSELTAVARYLYDLFVDKEVNKKNIPFLIACNKTEMITARSPEAVKADLEKEIEELRKSRRSMKDIDTSGKEEEEIVLGVEGEPFTMDVLPLEFRFCECSAKQGDIASIEERIIELFA